MQFQINEMTEIPGEKLSKITNSNVPLLIGELMLYCALMLLVWLLLGKLRDLLQ